MKEESFELSEAIEDMFSNGYTIKVRADDAFVPVKAETDFERMSAQNIIEDKFDASEITEGPRNHVSFVVKEEPIDCEESWRENIKHEPMSPLSRNNQSDEEEECDENDINVKDLFTANNRQLYVECNGMPCVVEMSSFSNQSSSGRVEAMNRQKASCSKADTTVCQEDAANMYFSEGDAKLRKQGVRWEESPDPSEGKSCNDCGETDFQKEAIPSGSLRSGTKDKCFKCSGCGKGFKSRGVLNIHVRIHTGDRPYECSQCGKSFTQRTTLNNHMLIHTGNRPYKCSQCGKSFTQRGNLNRHMCTHTGERPYKCSVCGKSVTQSSNLSSHMRTHTGERLYKCSQCEQCFTQSNDLHRHMRGHTGEQPYKCSQCEKSFKYRKNLKRHMHTHTG